MASERQLWIIIVAFLLMLLFVYIFLNTLVGKPIEALSLGIKRKDISLMKKMRNNSSEFGLLAKLVLDFSEHEVVLQSKAKDEAILSAVGSGLIVVDKNRKITLFNVSAEKLFGVSEKNALGKHVEEVFRMEKHSGGQFTNEELPLSRVLGGKKMISEIVLCVKQDGEKFPAVITAAPVILKGEVIGVVQDLRDITEEENLERGKRDFISLISHELRTPLTGLDWTVEKMETEKKQLTEEECRTNMQYMRSAINRIKTLTATMIDVSKIEMGSVITASSKVLLSSLVNKSIEGLKPSIENKKISLEINDDSEEIEIISDERLLQIIVSNLVSNAVKYCNENGQIKIDIKKDEKSIILKVKNTGPGIPKEEQSKIFTKMYRASNARIISPDGIGLGLYISKSFLEKLGGKLSFTSIPNKETIFTIKLPIKENPSH